ncbi:hypothetical protein CH289_07575 [Rhodococcus sp. RS1C4]|nr:hypothetical protein [Rhodococcus sp. RS1C4]OZC55045.1 hypothetical protein CH289_07575 [Rhodococcus sp. RS1C4]
MRTTLLRAGVITALALAAAACASTPEPTVIATHEPAANTPETTKRAITFAPPKPDPALTASNFRMQIDGPQITVHLIDNYSVDNAREVFETVQKRQREEDGYFVWMYCDPTEEPIGNGKFAVGAIGAARTGLGDGEGEFTPLPGAVCEV